MKYIQCIIFVLITIVVFSQNQTATLSFTAVDAEMKPLDATVYFYETDSRLIDSAMTGQDGKASIDLYIGKSYSIYIHESASKYDIQIPNYPGITFQQTFAFQIDPTQTINPTPLLGALHLTIINPKGGFIAETITLKGERSGQTFTCKSNSEGKASVLLPIDDNYSISFSSAPDYSKTTIPNEAFYILDKNIMYEGSENGSLHPTNSLAVIKLTYKDLEDSCVPEESITAINTTTGETFTAITNEDGTAYMQVPLGATYNISTKHFKDITSTTVPAESGKYVLSSEYKNISSKQLEQHQKELKDRAEKLEKEWEGERKRIDSIKKVQYESWKQFIAEEEQANKQRAEQAVADSIAEQRRLDSINKEEAELEAEIKRIEAEEIAERTVKQKRLDSIREARKAYEARNAKKRGVEYEAKKLMWHAEYETDNNVWGAKHVVFNVMKRNQWKKALYVVDVTGSMYPYAQLIKNWYLLNFNQRDTAHFVLFNDGDGKLTKEKLIGSTGGIYICESCGIRELDKTMRHATQWKGGDLPENDMEATLFAIDSVDNYDELVMLADNNSRVRDYSLLEQIKTPIRIVLCGVKDDVINEEYLNIANATKGSIHTIEEDVNFLKSLTDGDSITIGKRKYVYIKGSFRRCI